MAGPYGSAVLDDFDRADVTNSLGGNWTPTFKTDYTSHGISTNQAYADAGWPFCSNYWNGTSFGETQEVFFTLATLPTGTVRIWGRIQNPGGSSLTGYYILIDSTGAAYFEKSVAGTETTIEAVVGNGVPVWSAGDGVGMYLNGSSIEAWRYNGGSWALQDTTTDASVTGGGYIGFMSVNDSTARFNDFGGGTVVSSGPSPRSQYLDYDYSRS